jgi:hypothetical protein
LSWPIGIRELKILRSTFTTVKVMDYQEYSSHPMGPSIHSYHGYGSKELVYSGGAQEENNRLGSCKHTIFLNILLYTKDPDSKGGTPLDQEFYISPSTKGCHAKGGMLYHQPVEKLKEVVHCWKVEVDDIDDDDPRGIQIKESEGECTVGGKRRDGCVRLWSSD